jgi:hypothetical protein
MAHHRRSVSGDVWCDQLERAVRGRVDDVAISPRDRGTMTFSLGGKVVVVHLNGNGTVLVSPSLRAGGRLDDASLRARLQTLAVSTYEMDGTTVVPVADVIAEHLTGRKEPCRPRTLRDGYGMLDFLNDNGDTEQRRRRTRFLSLPYDGVPFGDHELRFRNADPTEIEYEKAFGEAIAFGHLAVAIGLDDRVANIENRTPPKPDLRVTLTDGTHVWIEVGRVTASESARYFGGIQKVNQHLRLLENADPAYLAEIQGRHVSVQLPTAPLSAKARQAADEIVMLLRSLDFETVQRKALIQVDPGVTPYLASLGADYYVGDGISTYVRASNGANCFDPNESVEDFYAMIVKKMQRTYAVNGPLWLVLPLTDLRHVPSLSMAAIRQRIPKEMGQFDRVVVGTMEDAEIIEGL